MRFGAIDPVGGDPLPIVSGGVTISDVYALLRASLVFQFSSDGTNWHDTQQQTDTYYRQSYPGGDWSEAIEIHNGTNGEDGDDAPNVKFQYSTNNSSWHDTPQTADCYFRTSNDDGTTWTSGLLFRNATVNVSNVIGFNDAVSGVIEDTSYTKAESDTLLNDKADKTVVANLGSIGGSLDFDYSEGDYQTLTLNGDLTLNSFTGFSIGDSAALQVTKNTGTSFYYNGNALIDSQTAGTFLIGLICVDENVVKVTSPTNLY